MPDQTYIPSSADIAAYLRARCVDKYGNYLDDWSADTLPTQDQVNALIQDAADEVAEAIGNDPPEDLVGGSTRAVALLAACNVELSFFPEQTGIPNSVYDKLYARYTALMSQLEEDVSVETVEEGEGADGVGTGYGEGAVGVAGFPPPSNWGYVPW